MVQAGRDFSVPTIWIHRQLLRMFWPQECERRAEVGSQPMLGSDSRERSEAAEVLTVVVSLLTGLLIMSGAMLVAVGAAKLQAFISPTSVLTTLIIAFLEVISFVVASLCTMGWIYQHLMVLRGTAGRLNQ